MRLFRKKEKKEEKKKEWFWITTGWRISIYLQETPPIGYPHEFVVKTWERAKELANALVNNLPFAYQDNESGIFLPTGFDKDENGLVKIKYVTINPIKKQVYDYREE